MKVSTPKVSFADRRGEIVDILQNEHVKYVTIISFSKGAVRGNHYHNRTEQYNYLVRGRLKITTRQPGGRARSRIIMQGQLFLIPRRERHVMVALKPSSLLVLTRGIRGGKNYEADTFRLKGAESLVPVGRA